MFRNAYLKARFNLVICEQIISSLLIVVITKFNIQKKSIDNYLLNNLFVFFI